MVAAYPAQDYDRGGDRPWIYLSPEEKAHIKEELNEFKAKEMKVHADSQYMTRFHK